MKIDEPAGVLFYTARDGDNPMKLQLHRVGLDGTRRPAADRPGVPPQPSATAFRTSARGPSSRGWPGRCSIAPDNAHFVDVSQTHDTPPATRLVDAADGRIVVGARQDRRLTSSTRSA